MALIETLITASTTLTSVLVVVIGFLLTQYNLHKNEVDYIWKPYYYLSWLMGGAILLSGISTILFFCYLIGLNVELFKKVGELFFLVSISIAFLGTFVTIIETLGD